MDIPAKTLEDLLAEPLDSVRRAGAVEWARYDAETWINSRGQKLFSQHWWPLDLELKRVNKAFVIVHGLHGHSGRYPHIAKILVEKGMCVLSS